MGISKALPNFILREIGEKLATNFRGRVGIEDMRRRYGVRIYREDAVPYLSLAYLTGRITGWDCCAGTPTANAEDHCEPKGIGCAVALRTNPPSLP